MNTYTSIWIWINNVATSTTLMNTDNKWIKKVLLEFVSTGVGLARHGRLFRDTYFMGFFFSELDPNDLPKLPIVQVLNNAKTIF